MKNYGQKIELHHNKCDVQFIKVEKRVYGEAAHCLLLDLVFPYNPK